MDNYRLIISVNICPCCNQNFMLVKSLLKYMQNSYEGICKIKIE